MTRATSDDVRGRPRRPVHQLWFKDPRVEWAFIVVLFIGFEFVFTLAAAGMLAIPAIARWVEFALALDFAAVEFWAAGFNTEA